MRPKGLLTGILRDVSRAFYLTLRVLPRGVREPVGLAYLLARAADTVADTPRLPPGERLRHLLAFRRQLRGPVSPEVLDALREAAGEGATAGERALMEALPQAFDRLESLADREAVVVIVETLTTGMEMDLTTFPPGELTALAEAGDLERYTFLVAGCVGEFWTRVTVAHTPALAGWDVEEMGRLGVRLGQALQLTNILRDLPRDLRLGRCYLPEQDLLDARLAPADLLDPRVEPIARPVLHRQVRAALHRYRDGLHYLLAIPWRCPRLRLAVLWPILIGLDTLALLVRSPHWLDPAHRVKVSRRRVYALLALSLPACCLDAVLRLWVGRLVRHVEAGLA